MHTIKAKPQFCQYFYGIFVNFCQKNKKSPQKTVIFVDLAKTNYKCLLINACSCGFGNAPATASTFSPPLKMKSAGILRIPN